MTPLTPTEYAELFTCAHRLTIDPNHLAGIIMLESSWDPKAHNKTTGARGLIQFTDPAAKDLGFRHAEELLRFYPDRISQLKDPIPTLIRKHNPFFLKQPGKSLQQLAMCIFYPAYRLADPDTPFPQAVQDRNPGIHCPKDYMTRVLIKAKEVKYP